MTTNKFCSGIASMMGGGFFSLVCKCLLLLSLLSSCSSEPRPERYNADPAYNFRALWKILDEGYCFFPERYPEPKGWKRVYEAMAARISTQMSEDRLFDLMAELIDHLHDGHVNLYSSFDVSSNSDWSHSPHSFYNAEIRNRYLGNHYRVAGSLYYTIIDYNEHKVDSIALVVCPSFSKNITLQHWYAVFKRIRGCRGLIVDIRNNGGGYVSNASTMASCFVPERSAVAFLSAKTGPGHHDFGPLSPIYVDPAPEAVQWRKPVVLLTNRRVYSAANSVTAYLKHNSDVYIVGDTTGGGGGLPISSELPNGWSLRYSSSRTLDAHKELIEWGVSPHFVQPQTDEATALQQDALIEKAIEYIRAQY